MPYSYKNAYVKNLINAPVLAYTCPAGVRAHIQGIHVCPLSTTPASGATITIDWRDLSPVPTIVNLMVGQSVILGDSPFEVIRRPIILEPGDTLYFTGSFTGSSSAGIVDATIGILEVS